MNARAFAGATAAVALGMAALMVGGAQAAPKPYTLGRVVIQQEVTLVNMQTGTGDFLYNPVNGTQTRPVTVDCPSGKVALSGGGKITTAIVGAPEYSDRPVMLLADSRPTATGWTLTWLAGNGMPGSTGTSFTAHISVVCANP